MIGPLTVILLAAAISAAELGLSVITAAFLSSALIVELLRNQGPKLP